jgi:hypothetical protein
MPQATPLHHITLFKIATKRPSGLHPLLQRFWVLGLLCLIVNCMPSTRAATLNGVTFTPGQGGQLEIQLNVEGEARQMLPKEQINDGVYALNMNADVSPSLQQNAVIMDSSGEYVGRVEQRGGAVSVVVPGVNPKNVKVRFSNQATGQPLGAAASMGATSKPFRSAADTLRHVQPTFQLNQEADSQASTARISSLKTPTAGIIPVAMLAKVKTSTTLQKDSTQQKKTEDTSPTEEEILTEEGFDTASDIEIAGEENTAFEWVEHPFDEEMMGWERDVENSSVGMIPECITAPYLTLPWENSDWLDQRATASQQADEHRLNSSVWSVWLNVLGAGMVLALLVLAKRYPSRVPRWLRWPTSRTKAVQSPFRGLHSVLQESQPLRNHEPNTLKPFVPAFDPAEDFDMPELQPKARHTANFTSWMQGMNSENTPSIDPTHTPLKHAKAFDSLVGNLVEQPATPSSTPVPPFNEPPVLFERSNPSTPTPEPQQMYAMPVAFTRPLAKGFKAPRFQDVKAKRIDQRLNEQRESPLFRSLSPTVGAAPSNSTEPSQRPFSRLNRLRFG